MVPPVPFKVYSNTDGVKRKIERERKEPRDGKRRKREGICNIMI